MPCSCMGVVCFLTNTAKKNALALLQSLPLYGLTSFRQITTLIKGYLYGNENISLGLYQSLCSLFFC